jgi:hypothetical protein
VQCLAPFWGLEGKVEWGLWVREGEGGGRGRRVLWGEELWRRLRGVYRELRESRELFL